MNAAFQISNALKAFFEAQSRVNAFLLASDEAQAKGARESLAVTVGQVRKMEKDQAEMEKLDASLKDDAKTELLTLLGTLKSESVRPVGSGDFFTRGAVFWPNRVFHRNGGSTWIGN